MKLEEQEALLDLWKEFLGRRRPSAALMREFYFEVVTYSRYYRYGMAPEVFDLLVNGTFGPADSELWAAAHRAAGDHRAA